VDIRKGKTKKQRKKEHTDRMGGKNENNKFRKKLRKKIGKKRGRKIKR
jgi:hypothetical protein